MSSIHLKSDKLVIWKLLFKHTAVCSCCWSYKHFIKWSVWCYLSLTQEIICNILLRFQKAFLCCGSWMCCLYPPMLVCWFSDISTCTLFKCTVLWWEMLYEVSAAWVTGINDVVSFAPVPLVFTLGFCVCQTPQLWIETFLSPRLTLAGWTSTGLGFSCGCSSIQNQIDLLMWRLCIFWLPQKVCNLLENKNKDNG